MTVSKTVLRSVSSARQGLLADGSLPWEDPDRSGKTALAELLSSLSTDLYALWLLDQRRIENTYTSGLLTVAYDFSGNARHATDPGATNRPPMTGNINGITTALFSKATGEFLILPDLELGNNRTFFVVLNHTSVPHVHPGVEEYSIISWKNAAADDMNRISSYGTGLGDYAPYTFGMHASATANAMCGGTAITAGTNTIIIATHAGTDPTTGITMRQDRVAKTLAATGGWGAVAAITQNPGAIGARGLNDSNGFDGAIGAIGVCRAISAPISTAIERFSLRYFGV